MYKLITLSFDSSTAVLFPLPTIGSCFGSFSFSSSSSPSSSSSFKYIAMFFNFFFDGVNRVAGMSLNMFQLLNYTQLYLYNIKN